MAFNIGRTGQEDDALMRWPPRSPDLTTYEFFLWGFVKDTVFVPPLPANLQDLRNRITAAVALVDRDMLTRAWNEMNYRIDVCRITVLTYYQTAGSKLRCQTPTKHTKNICEPLRVISVKHSSVLPDDGSHTIRNISE